MSIKIERQFLQEHDKGRAVIAHIGETILWGSIAYWNDKHVFVEYQNGKIQATIPTLLRWGDFKFGVPNEKTSAYRKLGED